jgi:hypothetical protein
MDYSTGKIYLIIDITCGDLYVGSTIHNLNERIRDKHEFFNAPYFKNRNCCKTSLIEEYPCKNKEELLWRERFWIDRIDCVNKRRPIINEEERNKMKLDNAKKWTADNIDRVNEVRRKRYHFRNSWGGDERRENNLLFIDVNLFN